MRDCDRPRIRSRKFEATGREARAEYEAKYTADCNYQMLMEIYQRAMKVSIQPKENNR